MCIVCVHYGIMFYIQVNNVIHCYYGASVFSVNVTICKDKVLNDVPC